MVKLEFQNSQVTWVMRRDFDETKETNKDSCLDVVGDHCTMIMSFEWSIK